MHVSVLAVKAGHMWLHINFHKSTKSEFRRAQSYHSTYNHCLYRQSWLWKYSYRYSQATKNPRLPGKLYFHTDCLWATH